MYIGRGLDQIDNVSTLDNLSFSGSTATFNLTQNSVAFTPVSADALQIQIDGVIQAGNYTVANATVTFDFTPSGSSVCNGIRHFGVGLLTTVSDSSITTAKLGADSVNGSKIADNSIDSEHYVDGSIDLAHMSSDSVNESKLQVSNSPTNGYMLTAQSGNTGGLTWAEAGSGTHVLVASSVQASTDVSAITLDGHVNHSLYSFYKFYARLEYSTNAITLNFRFRDSGSSITASNYNHTAFGKKNTAGTLADETQVNWGGGETNLATNVSYGYPSFISGELYHDVSGGIGNYSMMKGLHAIPRWNGSAHEHRIMNFHVTYDNGSQSTDGFTLYPSSGTFDRHEIYVYGVAK